MLYQFIDLSKNDVGTDIEFVYKSNKQKVDIINSLYDISLNWYIPDVAGSQVEMVLAVDYN